jgi:hypothetical protein
MLSMSVKPSLSTLLSRKRKTSPEPQRNEWSLRLSFKKLAAKKQQWLTQRGRELSAEEQKKAMDAWRDSKIDELKPVMLAEAKQFVYADLHQERQVCKTDALSIAKKEGRASGYASGLKFGRTQGEADGHVRGKRYGLAEAGVQFARAKVQNHAQSYDRGHAAGKVLGNAEGTHERL